MDKSCIAITSTIRIKKMKKKKIKDAGTYTADYGNNDDEMNGLMSLKPDVRTQCIPKSDAST